MLAPLSWLRDFAAFPDDSELLAAKLDGLGLVVEEVRRVGVGLDQVVVAEVLEIAPIEGADRIRKVVVDAGRDQTEVVCGAWNFSVGDLVPFAPIGTVLPGGMEIARRKMRGVTSNGMLCSGKELELSHDSDGLFVLTDIDGVTVGMAIGEALGVESDVVFDVTVEGNRPDAWSISGIARDLAAALRLDFNVMEPDLSMLGPGRPVSELTTLEVTDRDLCPRMTTRVLTGVSVGPSPRWLARRLTLAGMRPINNVVDASNYVMLELGQPTHPYDLDRLAGNGLIVRRAREGETLVTLDGITRTLGKRGRSLQDNAEDCIICDAEGIPAGVGGIIGGLSSQITESTTNVLFEAAYFAPMAVAKTSKRLAVRTEASARFERGCDPWGIDRAAARLCEIVAMSCAPGTITKAVGELDVRGDVPVSFDVRLPVAKVNSLLGTSLISTDVADLIAPIGFSCSSDARDSSVLNVVVPTDRPDVRPAPFGVVDIIEEVARVYGYANLPRRVPSWPQPGKLYEHQRRRRLIKDICCGIGAYEAWTSTFVADEDHEVIGLRGPAITVTNPLVNAESVLRRSLLPGLLRAIARNFDRREDRLRLFEVATVFSRPDPTTAAIPSSKTTGGHDPSRLIALPVEREMLCVAYAYPGDDVLTAVAGWRVVEEGIGLDGVVLRCPWHESDPLQVGSHDSHDPHNLDNEEVLAGLHPSRCAAIVAPGGKIVGSVGEIDPIVYGSFGLESCGSRRIGWLQLDLGLLFDTEVVPRKKIDPDPPSKFPSADVDLAFVVRDSIPVDDIVDTLGRSGDGSLVDVSLFDVYRGDGVDDGFRSLAFRLRMSAMDHTLSDSEIAETRQRSIDAVLSRYEGAALR